MEVRYLWTAIILMVFSTTLMAANVIEGGKAKKAYSQRQKNAIVIVQKNKQFYVRDAAGKLSRAPKSISVKVLQAFYMINGEGKFIHNVYDISDNSWILKKQLPTDIAQISFSTPSKHKLRCAIHPKMKLTVLVEK